MTTYAETTTGPSSTTRTTTTGASSTSTSLTSTDRALGRTTWRNALATGVAGAAAATAVALTFQAAGDPLSAEGTIPWFAFVQMVLIGTVIGTVVARRTSRTTFLRVAVALTVASFAPSLAWGDGAVDKAGLVLTHVVAAAIIVPRIARRG